MSLRSMIDGFITLTSLLAYSSLANVKSECKPHTRQYIDVVEAVARGGVVMPIPRLLGLGEIELEIGDGILYLQTTTNTREQLVESEIQLSKRNSKSNN